MTDIATATGTARSELPPTSPSAAGKHTDAIVNNNNNSNSNSSIGSESDSRINTVVDNDQLWKEFRREMSEKNVFTGMGVSQMSQAFLARRLGDKVNSEARMRANNKRTVHRKDSFLKTASIMLRKSISMSRSDDSSGTAVGELNRYGSSVSDDSSTFSLSASSRR